MRGVVEKCPHIVVEKYPHMVVVTYLGWEDILVTFPHGGNPGEGNQITVVGRARSFLMGGILVGGIR